MRHRWGWLTAVVLSLAFAEAARADAVIDDFQTSQSLSAGPANGPFGPLSSTVGAAGILGGSRTMGLSGNIGAGQTVSIGTGLGDALYNSGSRSSGIASLLYNGGGAGLGALLAMTNAIQATLVDFNHGSSTTTLSVTINDGSISQTVSLVLTAMTAVPQTLTFDFTGLGLNFNNIASLLVTLDSNSSVGADVVLQNLIARMTPVPEPMSAAIWSVMAVGGVWYVRRLRRQDAGR